MSSSTFFVSAKGRRGIAVRRLMLTVPRGLGNLPANLQESP
jgi:hypothetical protein